MARYKGKQGWGGREGDRRPPRESHAEEAGTRCRRKAGAAAPSASLGGSSASNDLPRRENVAALLSCALGGGGAPQFLPTPSPPPPPPAPNYGEVIHTEPEFMEIHCKSPPLAWSCIPKVAARRSALDQPRHSVSPSVRHSSGEDPPATHTHTPLASVGIGSGQLAGWLAILCPPRSSRSPDWHQPFPAGRQRQAGWLPRGSLTWPSFPPHTPDPLRPRPRRLARSLAGCQYHRHCARSFLQLQTGTPLIPPPRRQRQQQQPAC